LATEPKPKEVAFVELILALINLLGRAGW